MKKLFIGCLSLIFFLTACGANPTSAPSLVPMLVPTTRVHSTTVVQPTEASSALHETLVPIPCSHLGEATEIPGDADRPRRLARTQLLEALGRKLRRLRPALTRRPGTLRGDQRLGEDEGHCRQQEDGHQDFDQREAVLQEGQGVGPQAAGVGLRSTLTSGISAHR